MGKFGNLIISRRNRQLFAKVTPGNCMGGCDQFFNRSGNAPRLPQSQKYAQDDRERGNQQGFDDKFSGIFKNTVLANAQLKVTDDFGVI